MEGFIWLGDVSMPNVIYIEQITLFTNDLTNII